MPTVDPTPNGESISFNFFSFLGDWSRQAWNRLLKFNVLYLFSALMMLTGCYLISQPFLNLHRTLNDLLILLGSINVYELLVLGSVIFILRKLPHHREANLLLLIAVIFWLDATFTVNATIPEHFATGLVACAGTFAFICAKMFLLETGSRVSMFSGVRAILLLACLFLYNFQTVLVLHQEQTIWSGMGYLLFALWGALPLLWLREPVGAIPEPEPVKLVDIDQMEFSATGKVPVSTPWWQTFAFKRTVAWLTLLICGVHLLGQTWVYHTPVGIDYFAPVVLALLVTTPGWMGVYLADWVRNTWGAVWLLFVFVLQPTLWDSPVGSWSSLSFNLLFGIGVCLYLFYTERKAAPCDGAFIMGTFALLGVTFTGQWEQLRAPLDTILPWLMWGCAWWMVMMRRSKIRLVLGALLMLWWICHGLKMLGVWKNVESEYLRLLPLLLLTFGAVQCWHISIRLLLFGTGFYLGMRACAAELPRDLFYFYLAAPVLAYAAGRVHKHAVLPVLAIYAISGNLNRFGWPSFQGGIHKGWLVIAGAFTLFGLALMVTRFQVKQQALK